MAELREGEFDLDGYRFGTPENAVIILEGGFDTGAPEVRAQDADNPVGDGGLFGRDYLSGPTWSFTLGAADPEAEDVYTVLEDLARAWRNPAVRTTPGAVSTLRFRRGGRTWRVYGRPRRFGLVPGDTADGAWAQVQADFKCEGPVMYEDEAQEVTVSLGQVTQTDPGLVLPETLEWVLGGHGASGEVIANVRTLDPAPFEVYIIGPAVEGALSQISVHGPGFDIELPGLALAPGEQVHIDTRARTILKDGVSVAAYLSRRSRLDACLLAGPSSLAFYGVDWTGTSRARFVWRATRPIL